MRKYRTRRKRFYFLLVALLVVSMGLGYAYLTQQLNVSNTVSYDAMKWDVGFEEVIPVLWGMDDVKPTGSVSSDKKTAYINCDFGTSTSSRECVAVAIIRNDSTFNVELYTNPTITFNSALIKDVQLNWNYVYELPDGDLTDYEDQVAKGIVLAPGEVYEAVIRIISNDLTVDMLPSSVLSIPITIQLDWQQTEKAANNNFMDAYEIGNVVNIGTESFNIIDSTPSTVTMLAQKSLGSNYRQSDSPDYVKFSNNNGWEYSPGPKDIDIQRFDGPVKTYLNEYGSYLKTVTGDNSLISDLISVNQLKSLGCSIQSDDYSPTDGDTCGSSLYQWLLDDTWWWTKSAWNYSNSWYPDNEGRTLWIVTDRNYFNGAGILYDGGYWWMPEDEMSWGVGYHEGDFEKTTQAVRPVITMSKDKILKYLN